MVFDWTTEQGQIIDFLLEWMEAVHYGFYDRAWKEVKKIWNIKEEKFE